MSEQEEPEYPWPKDWVWGESGPGSGKWFPKATDAQVWRFLEAHSRPDPARLEEELKELERQLKWTVFLPRRLGDQLMIFFVLGFIIILVASFPLIAIVNTLFDADSGAAVPIALAAVWGVVVLWQLAQEHQRLTTKRDEVVRLLREVQGH